MAIAVVAGTGIAAGVNTSVSWTLPTGHALDHFLLAMYGGKPYDAEVTSGTFIDDYTSLTNHANGSTANGDSVGSVRIQCGWRTHDGSESNPSGTLSATPSPRLASMLAFSKTNAGAWDVQAADADDTSLTGTSVSCTPASSLDLAPGDMVIFVSSNKDNTGLTGVSFTASGITFDTITSGGGQTTIGNDGHLRYFYALVTAGTATVAPTFAATVSVNDRSDVAGVFIRLREPSLGATPSDDAGSTDSIAIEREVVQNDASGQTDAATAERVLELSQSDSAGTTDSASSELGTGTNHTYDATDDTGQSDSAGKVQEISVSDTAASTDSTATQGAFSRTASDSSGSMDSVSIGRPTMTVGDDAGSTDQYALSRPTLSLADEAGAVDSITTTHIVGSNLGAAPAGTRVNGQPPRRRAGFGRPR